MLQRARGGEGGEEEEEEKTENGNINHHFNKGPNAPLAKVYLCSNPKVLAL